MACTTRKHDAKCTSAFSNSWIGTCTRGAPMNRWTRRTVMQATLAGIASATMADTSPVESLDALARRKGLHFGSALGGRGLRDPNYLALVEAQCGVLVPENELKMAFVQRSPGEFQFE